MHMEFGRDEVVSGRVDRERKAERDVLCNA